MKKAWITMLSSVLILVLLLTGCGDAGDTTTDAQTNRTDVIIAQAGDAPSMDPHNCYDSLGMRVYMNIFEGLLHADETGKLEPALAESYEISEDGLVYTFHLRQGVTFQNGDSLTAEDVKFSLDRASDSPYCAEAADPIDSTAIIDAQTIAVTLKYAYEAQLPFFATTYLSIVSQKVVEEQGEDFSVNPGLAGTGPYVFKAWDKGVSVTLERNESYWGEKPFMQKVVYQNITEASAGDIAVESGDVDVYVHPSTADISTMESGDKVKVYQNASYYIEYLGFNMAVKPFDDVRVRQAISMCFDANDVTAVAVDGIGGVAANSFVSEMEFGHNPDLTAPTKDVEKAKALLTEAGYPNGFDCTITAVDGPRKKSAEVIQAAVKEIGINATIEVLESGSFFDAAAKGSVQMFTTGMTTLAADADPLLYTCFYSGNIGVYNFSSYASDAVDKLFADSRADRNADSRKAKLFEIQNIIAADVPAVPLYFRTTLNVANPNLKGLLVEPNNFLNPCNLSW